MDQCLEAFNRPLTSYNEKFGLKLQEKLKNTIELCYHNSRTNYFLKMKLKTSFCVLMAPRERFWRIKNVLMCW